MVQNLLRTQDKESRKSVSSVELVLLFCSKTFRSCVLYVLGVALIYVLCFMYSQLQNVACEYLQV